MHGVTHVPGGPDPIPGICNLCPTGEPPDYASVVLSLPDLRGYWRLGEGATAYLDTSGYNPADPADADKQTVGGGGTYTAMTTDYTPGGISVADDGAVQFNAAGSTGTGVRGDYLRTDWSSGDHRFSFSGDASFTVAAWVRPLANAGSWVSGIVDTVAVSGFGDAGANDNGWRLDMTWPTRVVGITRACAVTAGGSYTTAVSPAGLAADTWHFVVGTYDGSTLRLYLNATLVASQADSGDIVGWGGVPTFGIAGGPVGLGGVGYFYGAVDEIAVWARTLSAGEIAEVYQAGTSEEATAAGKVLTSDGAGGVSYEYPTIEVEY